MSYFFSQTFDACVFVPRGRKFPPRWMRWLLLAGLVLGATLAAALG